MNIGNFRSLKLKNEIKLLNAKGLFLQGHSLNLKIIASSENKVIFIIKKKIGNAPVRNKIKRQLRSIIAIQTPKISIHIMFIVKPNILTKSFNCISKEIETNISKLIFKLS